MKINEYHCNKDGNDFGTNGTDAVEQGKNEWFFNFIPCLTNTFLWSVSLTKSVSQGHTDYSNAKNGEGMNWALSNSPESKAFMNETSLPHSICFSKSKAGFRDHLCGTTSAFQFHLWMRDAHICTQPWDKNRRHGFEYEDTGHQRDWHLPKDFCFKECILSFLYLSAMIRMT